MAVNEITLCAQFGAIVDSLPAIPVESIAYDTPYLDEFYRNLVVQSRRVQEEIESESTDCETKRPVVVAGDPADMAIAHYEARRLVQRSADPLGPSLFCLCVVYAVSRCIDQGDEVDDMEAFGLIRQGCNKQVRELCVNTLLFAVVNNEPGTVYSDETFMTELRKWL